MGATGVTQLPSAEPGWGWRKNGNAPALLLQATQKGGGRWLPKGRLWWWRKGGRTSTFVGFLISLSRFPLQVIGELWATLTHKKKRGEIFVYLKGALEKPLRI